MHWHFFPWSQIPTLVGCVFSVWIAVKAWQRRPTPGTVPLTILMLIILLWSVSAALEDANDLEHVKRLLINFEAIGFSLSPLIWLTMLLEYLGMGRLLTRRNITLAAVVPCVGLLLCWTNPLHGLFFSRLWIDQTPAGAFLGMTYGSAGQVLLSYDYLLMLIGLFICLQTAISAGRVYREQALLLFVGGLIPCMTSIIDIFDAGVQFNLTPIAFLFTGAAMWWGMYQYRLWDMTPVTYSHIVRQMADGLFVIDQQYRIVQMNPAAGALLDVNLDAAIGNVVHRLLPKLPGITLAHFSTADTHLISEWSDVLPYVYDITISPLSKLSGQLSGWMVMIRDISERQRLELQLGTQAGYIASLQESDRAKNEFLAILSHELQTPMTAIIGWSEQALAIDTPEFHRQAMQVVQRNARRQQLLINDMLEMARFIHGKLVLSPVPADLRRQAQQAVENIQMQAEARQITVVLHTTDTPLPVLADIPRLQQCLGNVLMNSVKFTPAGGQITLVCRRNGEMAEVAVHDTGRGIAPEALPTLFELFHQEQRDERHGGLGLGLAIARGLIELHGGRIWADSPGERLGSTFTMALPLQMEADDRG